MHKRDAKLADDIFSIVSTRKIASAEREHALLAGLNLIDYKNYEQPGDNYEFQYLEHSACSFGEIFKEKLGFEYPLYMGPICLAEDNRVISYHIPPETVFHHKNYKWKMKDIMNTNQLVSLWPLLGEAVGPEPKLEGEVALVVYSFEYDIDNP